MTRKDKMTGWGRKHCGKVIQWKDLGYAIDHEAGTWTWFCPECGQVVQVDPFTPPDDLPWTFQNTGNSPISGGRSSGSPLGRVGIPPNQLRAL